MIDRKAIKYPKIVFIDYYENLNDSNELEFDGLQRQT